MKKRTVFIGAILSLISLGQPFLIKTSVVLSGSALMLSLPEKVYAGDNSYYFNRAIEKGENGDYYGAISDYTKAIELDLNNALSFANRGVAKEEIGDMQGACDDWRKASSLGDESAGKWVRNQC